jgi:large repetitive protein
LGTGNDRTRPLWRVMRALRVALMALLALLTLSSAANAQAVQLPDAQAGWDYGPVNLGGTITGFGAGFGPFGLNPGIGDTTLSGLILEHGSFSFELELDNSGVMTVYNLTVAGSNLTLDPTPLPPAMVGRPYSAIRGATGLGSDPTLNAQMICACITSIVPNPNLLPLFFPVLGISHSPQGEFSGTPNAAATISIDADVADFASSDSFGNIYISPKVSYTLVITPALALAPGPLANGTEDAAYSQPIPAPTGGAGPYTYAAIGTLPAGITVNPATGVFQGTPAIGSAGVYTVQVRATDANGYDITAGPYTLNIGLAALGLPATALPDGMVFFAYDQTIASATGGRAPYTYSVTAGALPPGVTMSATGRVSGTPSAIGPYAFTVTATDAVGGTVQQAYALAVTTLPDPRTADLLDLLRWQQHAAAVLSGDQIANIGQRLEQLRGGNAPGIVVVDPVGNAYAPQVQDAAGSAIESALESVLPKDFGIWTAGKLTVGTVDQNPAIDFASSSLTVGWDKRVTDMLTLGLAAGFGGNRGVIGTSGTTGEAMAKYVAAYASLQPGGNTFLEGTLGAGVIAYDTWRFVPLTSSFVTGHRDGQQVFGSLSGGFAHPVGALDLSAYGRLEGSFARLGAYTETGGIGALAFTAQDVWAMSGTLGIRADYSFHIEWGTVTPGIRIEYRHGTFGASDAMVNYASLLTLPGFGLSGSLAAENAGTIGVQTAFDFSGGLGVTVGYDAKIGANGTVTHSVRGIVGGSF